MASTPSNSLSEPPMIEQVITEFFAKSLHIILESRSPYVSSRNYFADPFILSPSSSSSLSSSSPSSCPRDKWFDLALKDCPAALENFDIWRQSDLDPLVVDVILVRRRSKEPNKRSEKIVERWVIQYENQKSYSSSQELHSSAKRSGRGRGSGSRSLDIASMYKRTYKRTKILLRSLYATVRLLPAYKLFRDLNSSGRICNFSLSHKISSFVEPFTQAAEAKMKQFSFVPVDTHFGRLSLSVSYLPTLEDLNVTSEPCAPISTQIIPDYVGSPTTERLKKLHSLSFAGSLPTYISSNRRHSWSNDHKSPSTSPSPSPTCSESHALHYNPSRHLPPRSLPFAIAPSTSPVSDKTLPSVYKKSTSLDGYWPSPPFSPSSSSSSPTHLQNSLPRLESDPVNIPNRGFRSQGLPPSPSLKGGKSGFCSQKDLRAQAVTTSASHTTSPERKLQPKKGSGDLLKGMTLQKILYSGKDEVGELFGWKLSPCSSPRVPSGNSSRFSSLDEFDDGFSHPFAVDYEDPAGSSRAENNDALTGDNLESRELVPITSSEARVGIIVRMLSTAHSLQDLPYSGKSSQAVGVEKHTASRLKKFSDALEELESYEQQTKVLCRQGIPQSLDVDQIENFTSEGPQ